MPSTQQGCSIPYSLNAFWFLTTALCVWFLFVHGPKLLQKKDEIHPILYVHLIGAYSIYLGCAHNTVLTPSVVGSSWHIAVGRISMPLGIVGLVTGFVYTWGFIGNKDLVFSVAISVGGVAQLWAQVVGYRSIKTYQQLRQEQEESHEENHNQEAMDKALQTHVIEMIALFVLACGIPALMRLSFKTQNVAIAMPLLIGGAFGLSYLYANYFVGKIKAKREVSGDGGAPDNCKGHDNAMIATPDNKEETTTLPPVAQPNMSNELSI